MDGWTLLLYACEYGQEKIVKDLVELGFDVNLEDHNGWIPLYCACRKGNLDIVKYLVEHGADINTKNRVIMLMEACWSDSLLLIKYLVELGLDVNKEDNNGWTLLFNTCQKGHENVVKY